ncbi:MAG: hypothetical protein A2527_04460 [Candidatus Lambdaproteobacteria bacterium RIFOXYD2_FULL_50_16]|uniref:Acriflavin resistance protein n=1 Tax=Candidatus Lambdaproteobacteria bacterium RIFOXYD2_FULL_50_16 TaxID=1817772 RepID=A0A1F6GDQ6_9PROT|nr:MAG: hypothetical protein A2527_04460 [Candidatus Lambdaproteobacteria bacterium RIFOXYD2_FULL_50_16]
MRFALSDLALERPASIYIFMLILIGMGFSAYNALPRESAPDIQIPMLFVTVPYRGASPEDVEALIIHKVETELQGLDNLKKISSTATEGAGMVTLEFQLGTDIDEVHTKVRESMDRVKGELPKDVEDYSITEINLSERPIMIVNLSGHFDGFQLRNIADDLKERIETIPGVLEVKRAGGLEREVKVEVDPDKLNYYQLDLNQVSDTIKNENTTIPAGDLEVGSMKYMIRVPGEIKSPAEIKEMVISAPGGVPIHVDDLAQVIYGYKEVTSRSRLNGLESVSLSVSKKSGENLVAIADRVKAIVSEEQARYGDKLKFTLLNDESKRIRSMVSDLENNIYTGMIMVVGLLMMVMGFKNSLFIGVSIPLSMLLTFIWLSWAGITLNFVVLFSLILALGMLVDNAIVVVENIYRHLETGLSPKEAAQVGVGEVAIPVISSTATTLVAFVPLLGMPGIAGEFMGYLPKTLILTLTASLFVGLILNPVLCSTLMHPHKDIQQKDEISMAENSRFLRMYRSSLLWALENRVKTLFMVITAWVVLAMVYFGVVLPKAGVEFFPGSEPGSATVEIEAPFGSTLATSDQIVRQIEASLVPYQPHTEAIVANVGQPQGSGGSNGGRTSHQSHITLSFPDWQERDIKPSQVVAEIRKSFSQFGGALISLSKPSQGPPTGKPVNLELNGVDPKELKRLSLDIQGKIKDIEGLVNLADNFSSTRSEIQVRLDRQKIAQMGLNTMQVANLIRTAFNGREVSTWRVGKDEYDIVVRLDPRFRNSVTDISGLYLKTPSGQSVALSELAKVSTEPGKGSIRHIGGKQVITISGDAEGVPGGTVLKRVQERLADFGLPRGYRIRYTGEDESRKEMQSYLGKSFLIAIFLIFLVLVTQFNSVLLPFIILTAVFMSFMGVFLGWIIHWSPLSIMMGGIGVISLAGVVVNNAIVLIDYINQLKAQGKSTRDALVLSGMLRMRPVLMTAITTILGLVPIVLGMDINFYRSGIVAFGSESAAMWQPMARSVIYGLGVATALTLIVVPVIYSLMESVTNWSNKIMAQIGALLSNPKGTWTQFSTGAPLSERLARTLSNWGKSLKPDPAKVAAKAAQKAAKASLKNGTKLVSKKAVIGAPKSEAPSEAKTEDEPPQKGRKIKLPPWLKRKENG